MHFSMHTHIVLSRCVKLVTYLYIHMRDLKQYIKIMKLFMIKIIKLNIKF